MLIISIVEFKCCITPITLCKTISHDEACTRPNYEVRPKMLIMLLCSPNSWAGPESKLKKLTECDMP